MDTSNLSKSVLTHIVSVIGASKSKSLAFAYGTNQHVQDVLDDASYKGFISYSLIFRGKDSTVDCDCTLNLKFEAVGPSFTNEGGDRLSNFKLTTQVNYSTYGSSNPEDVLARASVIMDTAKLAQEIEALFGDEFEVVVCSQEEMAKSTEARELNDMRSFFTAQSEKARNHQRVGTPRTITVSDEKALKYMATKKTLKFAVDDRTYQVTMTDKKDAEGKVIFDLARLV